MTINFDEILEEVGEFGRYQKLVTFLLTLPACFLNALSFAFFFSGMTPEFRCDDGPLDWRNLSGHNYSSSECYYYDLDGVQNETDASSLLSVSNESWTIRKCQRFVYDKKYFESTVITEWDLVCDKAIQPKIMMSVNGMVAVIGCLVHSYLQDWLGRKLSFVIILTISLSGNLLSVLSPSFLVFAMTRAVVALGNTALWNVGYIWALEYAGPRQRSTVTMIMCVMYGVATTSIGLLAWLCSTWVQLTLVTTVPFVVLYAYMLVIDESPRWLLSTGRNIRAVKVIRKIARWSGTVLRPETERRLLEQKDARGNGGVSGFGTTPRIQDLFRTPNLRRKTLLITYCWAANALTYVAITYNMENLKGNLYVNYSLQAIVEIPACATVAYLLERFGRIAPLSLSMIFSSLALFLSVPATYLHVWATVASAIIAKFLISISFAVLVQLAGEIYPTQLRALGSGCSAFIGNMVSTLMPYVVYSASVYQMLPMLVMGFVTGTSGVSVLMLPETMGTYMPETVAGAESGDQVGPEVLLKRCRLGRNICCGKVYRPVATTAAAAAASSSVGRPSEQEALRPSDN